MRPTAVFLNAMSDPEYLICLQCETPTYQFEFDDNGKLITVLCGTCGTDDPDDFASESELEDQQ
jgi:hypothetical protein